MSSDDVVGGCSLVSIAGIVLIAIGGAFIRPFPMSGSHLGYVTAIDNDTFCTDVYFKTDTQSSQEDTYTIPNDSSLMDKLKEANKSKKNVEINYHRNSFGVCGTIIDSIN